MLNVLEASTSTTFGTFLAPPPQRIRTKSSPGPPRPPLEAEFPRRARSRAGSANDFLHPSRAPQMPSFSIVGALEFRQVVASLRRQSACSSLSVFDTPVTQFAGGHYHSLSLSRGTTPSGESTDPWDVALGLPLNERPSPGMLITITSSDHFFTHARLCRER